MPSSENNKKQKDHLQYLRYAILFFFLIFMTWMGYRHQLLGGGPAGSPTVDALCPFGGLESIYSWLKDGYWLRRIALSSFVLFMGVAILTLLTGRVFCGWICPLGAVNEYVSAGTRKLGIKKIKLPPAVDKYLRYLKYVILLLIIYTTWKFGTLTFRDYDPWAAWMHLSAGWSEFGYGTAVLFATLFAGVFIERFWCRCLCPLGAFLAFISKFSLVKVYRDKLKCINCGKCSVACPVGLTPDKDIIQGNGELFDTLCENLGITHKLIRPRTPRHNGKVERSHRNDNVRFYSTLKFYNYNDLVKQMKAYLIRSNNICSSSIGWLTPLQKREQLIKKGMVA